MRGGCRYVRTALLSAPVQHMKRDRLFADVEERLRLEPNFPTERIRDFRVPSSYPLVAVVGGGTGTRHGRVKFDLGIAKRQIGVYVARIERFVQAAMELNILLRHILRLTPRPCVSQGRWPPGPSCRFARRVSHKVDSENPADARGTMCKAG